MRKLVLGSSLSWVLLGAVLLAPACKKDPEGGDATEEKEKKPPKPKKRTAYFGTVTIGKDVYVGHELEGKEAPKHWHYRVKLKGDVVQSYAWVSPSGKVHETVEFDRDDDALRLRFLDGYGVEVETRTLKKGKVTFRLRSGKRTQDGCETISESYDDAGHTTGETCLDRRGEIQVDVNGCARTAMKYDDEHALTVERCLDEGGKPRDDHGHTHERRYTYGPKGQRLTVTFASVGETPPGCAQIAYGYDDALNEAEERCLDADGKPMPYVGSKAVSTAKRYDENGCLISERYLDANGTPTLRADVGEWRFERNEQCQRMSEASYNLEGKLVRPDRGKPAKQVFSRDQEGLLTERQCFGPDDKPTACRPYGGVATVLKTTYDNQGRMLTWSGFSTAGKPARIDRDYPHQHIYAYDAFGHIIKREFFDEKGEPASALGGVHAMHTEYDELGQTVLLSNHGVDGALVLPTTHCAQVSQERDADHRLVRMRCLGTDGKPRRSRLIYNGINWNGAAELEVVRKDGKIENVLKRTNGTVIKTIDCSQEGATCMK